MSAPKPYVEWRADAAAVDAAVQRVRRRDLGCWRGEPVWLESSGVNGARRLVALRNGVVVPLAAEEPAIGSSLYGYGAPGWAGLSPNSLVVLRSDERALAELRADGSWGEPWPLGDGVDAGYVRRVDQDQCLVLVDGVAGAGRRLELVARSGELRTVYATANLVSDVVVSSNGQHVAWLEWPVGTMPWDAAKLWTARLRGDELEPTPLVVDGVAAQPHWIGDELHFVLESDEWSVPQRFDGSTVRPVAVPNSEFRPDWTFGRSWTAPTPHGVLLASVHESQARYGVRTPNDTYHVINDGPVYCYELCDVGDRVFALASSRTVAGGLWWFDAGTNEWTTVPEGDVARHVGSPAQWRRTRDGVPFVFRAPMSDTTLDRDDRPGLVVVVHGGPTMYASLEFSSLAELLCRCGLAVASVDYRGSTSYGRAYRRMLNGHWGEFDVADVASVVAELVANGEVNQQRVFARGSSAGAMTALLASRDDAVRGVVAVSAVTNLRQLALDSSEIERGYVAQLVGDEPTNEPFYARRSPTAFVDALAPRLLFIHGADDDVVPIAQTRSTVRALRATGRSVELVELPGERHGIGQPDNARRALESEMAFYRS